MRKLRDARSLEVKAEELAVIQKNSKIKEQSLSLINPIARKFRVHSSRSKKEYQINITNIDNNKNSKVLIIIKILMYHLAKAKIISHPQLKYPRSKKVFFLRHLIK